MIEMVQFFWPCLYCTMLSSLKALNFWTCSELDEPSNNSCTHCACSPVRPFAYPLVLSHSTHRPTFSFSISHA